MAHAILRAKRATARRAHQKQTKNTTCNQGLDGNAARNYLNNMPGVLLSSGDFSFPVYDDFPATIAGMLGWTSAVTGTGAANTALSASAATAALLRFSGGTVSVAGTTAAGIAAQELLGMTINNANGMGFEGDMSMAFDTAFPTATNAYVFLFGIFDSSGAVTTGNFIGLKFGWSAQGNAVANNWFVCADTVSRLIGNTPTAGEIAIPAPAPNPVATLPPGIALDVPQLLRFRIESLVPQSPIGQAAVWLAVKGFANGVPSNILVSALGANVYPSGIVPTNGFPAITNGWLGYKMLALAGTANTGKAIVDEVSYAILNRFQVG